MALRPFAPVMRDLRALLDEAEARVEAAVDVLDSVAYYGRR